MINTPYYLEDSYIIAQPTIKVYPSQITKTTGKNLWSSVSIVHELDQAQNQGQNNPSQSDPLGGVGQDLVQIAALGLAHVGFGTTGNGTGQASLLTGLQQNHNNQSQASNSLQNSQNDFHIFNLPQVLNLKHSNIIAWLKSNIKGY